MRASDLTPINISRYPDDQLCMRASIGGAKDKGYYLVMRLHKHQTQSDMVQMLENILEILRLLPPLDVEQPKPGKFGMGGN